MLFTAVGLSTNPGRRSSHLSPWRKAMQVELPEDVGHGLDAMLREANIPEKRPDDTALKLLKSLHNRWPRAAEYVLNELRINLGVGEPGGIGRQQLNFEPAAEYDEGGSIWRMNTDHAMPCRLVEQPASKLSAAVTGIVRRWNVRLDEPSNECLRTEPRVPMGGQKRPRNETPAQYIKSMQRDDVSFELRFRLEAAGGSRWQCEAVLANSEDLSKVKRLHDKH